MKFVVCIMCDELTVHMGGATMTGKTVLADSCKQLQQIASEAHALKRQVLDLSIGIKQHRQACLSYEALKARFNEAKPRVVWTEGITDLRQLFDVVLHVVNKLFWFGLLDLGRLLKKLSGMDEYCLVKRLYNLDDGLLYQCSLVHAELAEIGHKLNQRGRAAHGAGQPEQNNVKGTPRALGLGIREGFYWLWRGCEWAGVLPALLVELTTYAIVLPTLMAYAPIFVSVWLFIHTSYNLPDSRLGYVLYKNSANILRRSANLLAAMRMYFLGFSDAVPAGPVGTFTEAVAPRKIDWTKFVRGALYVFIPLLCSHMVLFYYYPVQVNPVAWVISFLVATVYYSIQTLCEEIEFRRPAANQSQSLVQLCLSTLLSSILFGVAHLWNPEFSTIGGNTYSILAMLSKYCADGLFWGLACYCTGGLELTWGMHFANNFFLATVHGYYPSPTDWMPLLLENRGKSSPVSRYYRSIDTVGKFVSHLLVNISEHAQKWSRIYVVETILGRDLYALPEIESQALASRAMAANQHETSVSKQKPANTLAAFFYEASRTVRAYVQPFSALQPMLP